MNDPNRRGGCLEIELVQLALRDASNAFSAPL